MVGAGSFHADERATDDDKRATHRFLIGHIANAAAPNNAARLVKIAANLESEPGFWLGRNQRMGDFMSYCSMLKGRTGMTPDQIHAPAATMTQAAAQTARIMAAVFIASLSS